MLSAGGGVYASFVAASRAGCPYDARDVPGAGGLKRVGELFWRRRIEVGICARRGCWFESRKESVMRRGCGFAVVDRLEERVLFTATFTVSNTLDSGAGSLRLAILQANVNP